MVHLVTSLAYKSWIKSLQAVHARCLVLWAFDFAMFEFSDAYQVLVSKFGLLSFQYHVSNL